MKSIALSEIHVTLDALQYLMLATS